MSGGARSEGDDVALTGVRVPGRARYTSWYVRERRLVEFTVFVAQTTEGSCR